MAALAFERQTPLTATVSAADGIRFVAAAYSSDELIRQIAGYIRSRSGYALWPEVGGEVRRLLDAGRPYAAIALYFGRVGERWDHERLDIRGMSFEDEVTASPPALVKQSA